MSAYHAFTSTRQTEPDRASLLVAVRAATDDTAGYAIRDAQHVLVKKATAFSGADLVACQAAIDTCPASSPELSAQNWVDRMPLEDKAVLLTIIDELNRRRQWDSAFKAATAAATSLADLKTRVAQLPDAPDITVAAAIQAVRDTAGSL